MDDARLISTLEAIVRELDRIATALEKSTGAMSGRTIAAALKSKK